MTASGSTGAADLDAYGFVENGVPIAQYLRCPSTGWDFVLHARAPPPLFVDVDRFAPFRDTKIPLLLHAVSCTQQRSQELNSFPTRKADFWATIFPSHTKPSELQLGIEKWMMEHEAFPHIVLNFHQTQITQQRLNMLFRFMTTSESRLNGDDTGHGCEELRPAIGLKFTQCEDFSTESLKRLLAFLDKVFVDPARRFEIRSLNLSNNQMNVEQLVLLSELLEKNQRVYRIENVALNDIFFSRERESDEADQIASMLGGIFKNQSLLSESPAQLVLKRLSFDHSSLRLQHFAAMCSSLRYGCSMEELSLLSTLNRVSAADRQQCWRWLAFALFHPRSTHHQSSFRLEKIDLSRIELRVADAKAIKNTLLNPAAELVYNGSRPSGLVVELISMCQVRMGTRVHESPDATSLCIAALDCDQELEALVRNDDGWACVVFPGFGLGWVESSQVERSDCGASYGPQTDNLIELTIHRLSSKKAPISTLLECVGQHLSHLSLKYNTVEIVTIQKHCVNLKHLDLEGCSFQGSSMKALVDVAHRPFFNRLVSLNLNDTEFGDDDARRLSEALSAQDSPPAALRELRVISSALTFEGYEGIHTMLTASKTLSVVELVDPRQHLSTEMFRHLTHWHQGKLLEIYEAPRDKAAFLSVLTHESAIGTSKLSLDSNLVAMIFDFAGAPVRRRIMWRASSDGDY